MNAITKHNGNGMDLMTYGQVFAKSGFFQDSRDAAQAVVKIQAGAELGFPPVASMTGIHIIKGRVSLSANLIAAAIKRSGKYTYRVSKLDDAECVIEFFEGSTSIGVSSFGIADAKRQATQNIDRFPRNMLFARAISNGAKWYCPDVFGGPIYTPDELGAEVDDDGNVQQAPPPPRQLPAKAVEPDHDAAEPEPATEEQAVAIREYIESATEPDKVRAYLHQKYGTNNPGELTTDQATHFLDVLRRRQNAQPANA